MPCDGRLLIEGRAGIHFRTRFRQRSISYMISFEELIDRVERAYRIGAIKRDERHKGIAGPRYRVEIPLDDTKIVVIVEKTERCLLSITLWPEEP
ncbi:MAG: hypothetical protein F7C82_03330 [Desulfurococcales archaeon]|nr:hypothetical protein [Desulfurococcales archaeon]